MDVGLALALMFCLLVYAAFQGVCSAIASFIMFFVDFRSILLTAEIILVFAVTCMLCKEDGKKGLPFVKISSIIIPSAMICITCITPQLFYLDGEDLAGPVWSLILLIAILPMCFSALRSALPFSEKWKSLVILIGGLILNIGLLATVAHNQLIALGDYFSFRIPF